MTKLCHGLCQFLGSACWQQTPSTNHLVIALRKAVEELQAIEEAVFPSRHPIEAEYFLHARLRKEMEEKIAVASGDEEKGF